MVRENNATSKKRNTDAHVSLSHSLLET